MYVSVASTPSEAHRYQNSALLHCPITRWGSERCRRTKKFGGSRSCLRRTLNELAQRNQSNGGCPEGSRRRRATDLIRKWCNQERRARGETVSAQEPFASVRISSEPVAVQTSKRICKLHVGEATLAFPVDLPPESLQALAYALRCSLRFSLQTVTKSLWQRRRWTSERA